MMVIRKDLKAHGYYVLHRVDFLKMIEVSPSTEEVRKWRQRNQKPFSIFLKD